MTTTTEQSIGHRFDIEPGDWFLAHWGYDQTNATFYRVERVSKSGKSVTVQEFTNETIQVQDRPGQDDIVQPDLDRPYQGQKTFRLQVWEPCGPKDRAEAYFVTARWAGAPRPRLLPKSEHLPMSGQTNSVEGH
jgi:hypothetical protein